MIGWQRFEGAVVFAVAGGFYLAGDYGLPPLSTILVFFAADLSFLAYLAGARAGAWAYNAMHNFGFGAAILTAGAALGLPVMIGIGILLIAHIGFDRMLGYGLKARTEFGVTHLGRLGKGKAANAAAGPLKRERLEA